MDGRSSMTLGEGDVIMGIVMEGVEWKLGFEFRNILVSMEKIKKIK